MTRRLIAIRLRSFVGSFIKKRKDGSSRISKGKLAILSAVFGYVGLTLAGLFTLYSYLVGSVMLPLGLEEAYLGAFMTIDFAVIFFLSVFEMKSQLFECRDNELLLSMPVPPSAIVTSRVMVVVILNIIESLIFMLPAVVMLAILGGSAKAVAGGALCVILIPLFATSLSAGVGCLFAAIARRMKRMAPVKALLGVGAILLFYKIYFGIFDVEDEMLGESLAQMLNNPYMHAVGLSATFHPIASPIFGVLSIGGSALAFYIISKTYVSVVTVNRSSKKAEYRGRVGASRSPFIALSLKELKRYASSSGYILNSSLGLVFAAILGGAGIVYRDTLFELSSALSSAIGIGDVISVLYVAAGVFCLNLNTASAAALSLEGNSFFIIKSMPISPKTVLLAKCTPQIVVGTPFAIGFGICSGVALRASVIEYFLYIAISVVTVFLFAFVGIIFNTLLPKFKFENIVQAVKQSGSVFFTMLSAFVVTILVIALGVISCSAFGAVWAIVVMLVALLLLCGVSLLLLLTVAVRRYESFNA